MSRLIPVALGALAVAALSALGCSVDAQAEPPGQQSEKSYALIAVERTALLNTSEPPQAQAIVGFARLTAGQQASARSLGGLGVHLPELNQCVRVPQADVGVGSLEFVDAGDVVIEAAGARTSLAPRALPTVDDLISGVIYTSRDQDARLLPAESRYSVRALGGLVQGFEAEGTAPRQLRGINVSGQALESIERISASAPLDVSWEEGDANDVVLVELAGPTGGVACLFRDDLGAGTVATSGIPKGAGRLSLHRIRTLPLARQSGELSFDFEITLPVEVRE